MLNDISRSNYVDKVFKSNKSGEFSVIKYNNAHDVLIEFKLTGYMVSTSMSNLKMGVVKDPYFPSVYNVGIVGEKYSPTIIDMNGSKKSTLEYQSWVDMLGRCYRVKTSNNLTYRGCTVSENFKHYEYFYEWCNMQIGFGNTGWCLDKDLLVKGNKVYSEDTCVFLPHELNVLLTKRSSDRGKYPLGVSYHKHHRKFSSQLSQNGVGKRHLGYYNTPEEAFLVYKKAKEDFIKQQALKWKDQIDHRAFEALVNYEVDIND